MLGVIKKMAAATPFQNCEVVIGHGPNCNDGVVAMWAVWRTLSKEYRDRLAAVGGFYSNQKMPFDPTGIHPNSPQGGIRLQEQGFPVVFVYAKPKEMIPPQLVTGKRVLILDVDLGDTLTMIVKVATSVFVCDHHESSDSTIGRLRLGRSSKFNCCIVRAVTESAASLTWRLTHTSLATTYPYKSPFPIVKPDLSDRSELPPLIEVVRIGDNKQWQDLPELKARAILQTLFTKKAFRSFLSIEKLHQTWTTQSSQWAKEGKIALAYQRTLVRQAIKKCSLGYIQTGNGAIFTVAYVEANILHSEIGAQMKAWAVQRFKVRIDFVATWQYIPHCKLVSVSLRDPAPGINLDQVAQQIKDTVGIGGGHPHAASFSFYGLDRFHSYLSEERPIHGMVDGLMPTLTY